MNLFLRSCWRLWPLLAVAACHVQPERVEPERPLTSWGISSEFRVSDLDPETGAWYRRVRLELAAERAKDCLPAETAPEAYPLYPSSPTIAACSGVKHYLGRALNYHVTTLLTLFRVTGDAALLEEVDRVMELAKSRLRDTDGDGYRNWAWLEWLDEKDFNLKEDSLAHGFIAEVAYVLERNAHLGTPAHPYGAHAEEWKAYLREDFEGKWAGRGATRNTEGLPVSYIFHPFMETLRYTVYMSKLFPEEARYRRLRAELTEIARSQFKRDGTERGDAFVWSHFVRQLTEGATPDTCLTFQHRTYPVQVMQVFVDLALEGHAPFSSDAAMRALSRSLSESILEPTEHGFMYKDVGGPRNSSLDLNVTRKTRIGGWCFSEIPYERPGYEDPFMSENIYLLLPWSLLTAWGADSDTPLEESELYRTNRQLYGDPADEETPVSRIYVPAAMAFARLYAQGGYKLD